MAQNSRNAPATKEKRRPQFNLAGKVTRVTSDGTKRRWMDMGVMWSIPADESGHPRFSITLNALPPAGWDGSLLASKWLSPEERRKLLDEMNAGEEDVADTY